MISTVLFDLEGTLVDFQWQLEEAEEALRQALAPLGFDPELFAGADYAAIRHRALDRAESAELRVQIDQELKPIYDRYDADALSRWNLRDGAHELVRELTERGIALGVVSIIGRRAGWAVLDKFDLRRHFQLVIAREDVTLMKPSGEGIRKALAELGTVAKDAIMVGDSLTDLRAARDAGVRVALISGGETIYRELGEQVPDHTISELPELLKHLFPTGEQERHDRPRDHGMQRPPQA